MNFENPHIESKEQEIDWEDRFYTRLEVLGVELAQKWEDALIPQIEANTITYEQAFTTLGEVLAARKNTLDNLRANASFGSSERVKEELRETVENIRRSMRPDNFLGNGASAEVYTIDMKHIEDFAEEGENSTIQCCKIIVNNDRYQEGNSVFREKDFLETLQTFEVNGVRTPQVYRFFSGGDFVAILMEKLEAVDLQRVIEGHDQMPETFQFEDFFQRLENYMAELHKKSIFHNDLYLRNIMVDKATGYPRVIDFGKSIYHPFSNDTEKSEKADWAQFQASKFKLRKFLEQKPAENIDKNN